MDYTKILKRAWQITWRYKALWVFGFLSALFSGSGMGGGQGPQYVMRGAERIEPGAWLLIAAVLLLAVLVLVALSIVLGSLSKAALIGMVREVEQTSSTSVRSGWRIGWSHFLRLFAIGLAIGIPAVIVSFVLIGLGLSPLLLLLAESETLTILAIVLMVGLMLVVIGLLIVMGVVLSVVGELAERQCVLDGKGVWESIRAGYQLGRQNLKHVGVTWLLLFAIDLGFGIVMAPVFFVVFGAAAVPGILTYVATEAIAPTLVIGIPVLIVAGLIMTALTAVYQVFRSAVWTLTYLEL
jgi:hypothetical protein